MADYYPLISRAVAGLEKSTGENRRALYERARKALVDQLRGVQPALSETDITRERLALEEAIRKVETEAARAMRAAPSERRPQRTEEPAPPPPAPTPADDTSAEASPPDDDADDDKPPTAPDAPPSEPLVPSPSELIRRSERHWIDRKIVDNNNEGIKGFGDVVADAESLGDAVAQAGRSARETFTQVPSPSPEFDRIEPRIDPEAPAAERPRPPERPRAPERPLSERPLSERARPQAERPQAERPRVPPVPRPTTRPPLQQPRDNLGPVIGDDEDDDRFRSLGTQSLEPPVMPDTMRYVSERARRSQQDHAPPLIRRMMGGLIKTVVVFLVLALVAGTAWWQRDNLKASGMRIVNLVRSPATAPTPQRDTNQQRAKISDRIGQPDAPSQQEAPVAQRVVLYEEDPADSAGKRFVGNVVWRVENVSPSPSQPPDRVVRADITIPERNMQVTWTLGRNFDKSLQFSHTISIQFGLPPNFAHGEVSDIRGVLMKPAEQVRGESLAGFSVKVTNNYFLIGLNSAEAELIRNTRALKERPWFDIALVYKDGRRAILAVEKGTPGERAFNETFAAWGQ